MKCWLMSALGQKPTYALQKVMSALPSKADKVAAVKRGRGTARQGCWGYLADKATCGFKTKNKSAPHIASIATISATTMTL
jgi:hypothetical protein